MMQSGIQISSFRPLMKTEAEMRDTFRQTAMLGCRFVQLQWIGRAVQTEKIAEALKENGLNSVSVQDLSDNVLAEEEYYLRLNEQTGGKWLCVSRIPERMKSPEGLEGFMNELQRLSERCAAYGQELCLHPVADDYLNINGKCPVDEILAGLPQMKLCLDLYHLAKAGYSAPAWMDRWPDRIELVHFKDEQNSRLVPAGQGNLCNATLVRACLNAKVSFGFVEQESWDGDPFACLGEAFRWLNGELAAAGRETVRPASGEDESRE